MRRHRVELDEISYETLKYVGLLRGVPLGHVLAKQLSVYADALQKEFPAVRAHCLAVMQARGHDVEIEDSTVQFVIPF